MSGISTLHEPVPYLSVCSGIEAFSVSVHELDFVPVAFAEIEDFPSRVLAYRFPDVPNLGDMTNIDVSALGPVGWLVGGTPCQSFSVAGMRRGLDDDRGNLTLEYVKLAHRLADQNGLRGLLWENVPGVLNHVDNPFGCFVGGIIGADDPLEPGPKPRYGRSNDFWRWKKPGRHPILDEEGEETGEFEEIGEGQHVAKWPSIGMASGPRSRLAWRILDSRYFGVPQRRRRVFVVADFGDGPDPAAVLFEPRGQGWGAEAGGEAGENVAGTISARPTGGRGLGTDMDLVGGLQAVGVADVAGTLDAHAGRGRGLNGQDAYQGKMIPMAPVAVFDPNQITSKANRSQPEDEVSHTMPAVASVPVLFSVTPSNSNKDYNAREKDFAQALSTAVAFNLRGREGGSMPELGTDQASALRSADGGSSAPMAMTGMQVRRLTPTECERLQGFQDGWTLVPGLSGWRKVGDDEDIEHLQRMGLTVKVNKKTGRARVNDPDGPRYKALGNSFTTEPVNWIMSRVQASLRGEPMPDWQPMQLWKRGRC